MLTKLLVVVSPVIVVLLALICPTQAAAHSLFPTLDSPEFRVEKAAADLAKARTEAANGGVDDKVTSAAESVYASTFVWRPSGDGRTVTACFWNGEGDLQRQIIASDKAWEGFAALHVDYFGMSGEIRLCRAASSADIRISVVPFDPRLDYGPGGREPEGFWSLIGRQANFAPQGVRPKLTVNLSTIRNLFVDGDTEDFNFLVRHEMGHARGLLHEHQRKECIGQFNVKAIADSQNWSLEKAQGAVATFDEVSGYVSRYLPHLVGPYDKSSIMQYNFARAWYADQRGASSTCARQGIVSTPSEGDKATLVAVYGSSASQVPAAGAGPAAAPQVAGASDEDYNARTTEAFNSALADERKRVVSTDGGVSRGAPTSGEVFDEAGHPTRPPAAASVASALKQLEAAVREIELLSPGN